MTSPLRTVASLCAALVFLMQGGFLCLESGLTRTKNSINVAFKNVADFSVAPISVRLESFVISKTSIIPRRVPPVAADRIRCRPRTVRSMPFDVVSKTWISASCPATSCWERPEEKYAIPA